MTKMRCSLCVLDVGTDPFPPHELKCMFFWSALLKCTVDLGVRPVCLFLYITAGKFCTKLTNDQEPGEGGWMSSSASMNLFMYFYLCIIMCCGAWAFDICYIPPPSFIFAEKYVHYSLLILPCYTHDRTIQFFTFFAAFSRFLSQFIHYQPPHHFGRPMGNVSHVRKRQHWLLDAAYTVSRGTSAHSPSRILTSLAVLSLPILGTFGPYTAAFTTFSGRVGRISIALVQYRSTQTIYTCGPRNIAAIWHCLGKWKVEEPDQWPAIVELPQCERSA